MKEGQTRQNKRGKHAKRFYFFSTVLVVFVLHGKKINNGWFVVEMLMNNKWVFIEINAVIWWGNMLFSALIVCVCCVWFFLQITQWHAHRQYVSAIQTELVLRYQITLCWYICIAKYQIKKPLELEWYTAGNANYSNAKVFRITISVHHKFDFYPYRNDFDEDNFRFTIESNDMFYFIFLFFFFIISIHGS